MVICASSVPPAFSYPPRGTCPQATRDAKAEDYDLLIVDVLQARGLVSPTQPLHRAATPYASLTLGAARARTACAPSLQPVWHQAFRLAATDFADRLRIVVYAGEPTPQSDGAPLPHPIGQYEFDPAAEPGAAGERWLALQPRRSCGLPPQAEDATPAADVGEVLVRWQYVDDRPRRYLRERRLRECTVLWVEVLRAQLPPDLQYSAAAAPGGPAPGQRLPNAFVRLDCNGDVVSTRVSKRNTEPWWRESFELKVGGAEEQAGPRYGERSPNSVVVQVLDRGETAQGDTLIGEVDPLPLDPLPRPHPVAVLPVCTWGRRQRSSGFWRLFFSPPPPSLSLCVCVRVCVCVRA